MMMMMAMPSAEVATDPATVANEAEEMDHLLQQVLGDQGAADSQEQVGEVEDDPEAAQFLEEILLDSAIATFGQQASSPLPVTEEAAGEAAVPTAAMAAAAAAVAAMTPATPAAPAAPTATVTAPLAHPAAHTTQDVIDAAEAAEVQEALQEIGELRRSYSESADGGDSFSDCSGHSGRSGHSRSSSVAGSTTTKESGDEESQSRKRRRGGPRQRMECNHDGTPFTAEQLALRERNRASARRSRQKQQREYKELKEEAPRLRQRVAELEAELRSANDEIAHLRQLLGAEVPKLAGDHFQHQQTAPARTFSAQPPMLSFPTGGSATARTGGVFVLAIACFFTFFSGCAWSPFAVDSAAGGAAVDGSAPAVTNSTPDYVAVPHTLHHSSASGRVLLSYADSGASHGIDYNSFFHSMDPLTAVTRFGILAAVVVVALGVILLNRYRAARRPVLPFSRESAFELR